MTEIQNPIKSTKEVTIKYLTYFACLAVSLDGPVASITAGLGLYPPLPPAISGLCCGMSYPGGGTGAGGCTCIGGL